LLGAFVLISKKKASAGSLESFLHDFRKASNASFSRPAPHPGNCSKPTIVSVAPGFGVNKRGLGGDEKY
jgi:hypothetical protein